MPETQVIRVGLVGAGANTRLRHIPGFRKIEGVEIVAVANRTRTSSEAVASEYGIPRVFDDWEQLVASPEVDAICIGTWPYMHGPVSVAALQSGKHVLTEARMAATASEAHEMLEVSRRHPGLVAQVVPSPMTFKVDRKIKTLIAEGFLGAITAIDLAITSGTFPDIGGLLHWRHESEKSGYNVMTMGIWYESLMRWVGPATRVMAMARVVVRQRRTELGEIRAVTIPDHVDVLCDMACGAQAHLSFSAVTGLGKSRIWLFGTEGTLCLEPRTLALSGGHRGDKEMQEISIPPEIQGDWRVEEEFINAIRGIEPVMHTTFEDGVAYMEFTEAVARSSQTGAAVNLPLWPLG